MSKGFGIGCVDAAVDAGTAVVVLGGQSWLSCAVAESHGLASAV